MKTYKIVELKPGMKFTEPVYVDGENLLVQAGIPLKEKEIERLKKWGLETVQTEGEIFDEDSAGLDGDMPSFLTTSAKELFSLYSKSIDQLDGVFLMVRNNEEVDSGIINGIVNSVLEAMKKNTEDLVAFTLHGHKKEKGLAATSVNCMIQSLLIGLQLKMPSHRLLHLAIGALLHDVGMNVIPDSIVKKEGDLTSEERKKMMSHPLMSQQIVTKRFSFAEEIGDIVCQHHERWDGKGYPRKISGENILLSARIISVVDAFEAMMEERPYRDPMSGYTAIRQILNDNSRRFDSTIIKIFIKAMGIYPVSSLVILNDGSIAKVLKVNPDAHLRPVLQIIIDKNGKKLKRSEGTIDLVNKTQLFIARAIDPGEMNKANIS